MHKLNCLRLARLQAGKSQFEAAVETGVSQTLISLYERKLKQPRREHLTALAECYGKAPEELLDNCQWK